MKCQKETWLTREINFPKVLTQVFLYIIMFIGCYVFIFGIFEFLSRKPLIGDKTWFVVYLITIGWWIPIIPVVEIGHWIKQNKTNYKKPQEG